MSAVLRVVVAFSAVGMVIALILALYVYIRLRISRRGRPMSFMSRLTFFENTKEDYLFFGLIVVAIILGNVVVRVVQGAGDGPLSIN
jgi:hypothetical protein